MLIRARSNIDVSFTDLRPVTAVDTEPHWLVDGGVSSTTPGCCLNDFILELSTIE
jgi:hypothetical protein